VTGRRPPSGTDNITATYRHGAGAAKPGDGQVNAIAKAIAGVEGVAFSLAATGGSDAESADDIRATAPASTLTFGRAVSLADYSALARSYPSVVNAAAGWAIDPASQRAAVRVVGGDALARLYRDALDGFGLQAEVAPSDAAARGLWRIAAAAGLAGG